jgi:aminopeptidase N
MRNLSKELASNCAEWWAKAQDICASPLIPRLKSGVSKSITPDFSRGNRSLPTLLPGFSPNTRPTINKFLSLTPDFSRGNTSPTTLLRGFSPNTRPTKSTFLSLTPDFSRGKGSSTTLHRGFSPKRGSIIPLCILLLALSSCKTKSHVTKEPPSKDYTEVDLGEVKIIANPPYKGFDTKYFDLLHMDLSVKPDWKHRYLDGTAVLTLTPHAYAQDSLILDAKDFDIRSVQLVNSDGDSLLDLKYSYDKRKLIVKLQKYRPYDGNFYFRKSNVHSFITYPGDTINVKIIYIAKPEDQYKDSVITKKIEQGLYFINPDGVDSGIPREMWSQGETEHNSDWFPTIDALDQKYTQEIAITVDTAQTTLSNGTLDFTEVNGDGTKTDHWSMDLPHSPYLTMIAVGTYSIIKDTWRDSIPVNYYVEPEYAPFAKLVFGHTPAMIEYFSKLLKYDYPWPKYSQVIVRDFTSGAMENTTATVLYEPVQHDDHAQLDHTEEEVISHELFHHWFGDLVTCKSWAYLSLNESFASFSEAVWEEHQYGRDAASLMRKQALDGYLAEAVYHKTSIIDHYYGDPEDLFDKHRYEKGALVLNMLRHYLGDEIFFKALHNYLVSNAYKNTELSDLRKAMEDASGEDLNWFFTEWFEKPGHPVLEISQEYKEKEGNLYLYVKQTQKDDKIPLFRAKVKVLQTSYSEPNELGHNLPGNRPEDIWLNKASDTFVFECAKPLNVKFDAENILLCQKSEVKPLEQWIYQYNSTDVNNDFQSRLAAVLAISKKNDLMTKAASVKFWKKVLNDPFWYIRRQGIVTLEDMPDSIFAPLLPKIEEMALQDKDSKVRAMALYFLGDKEKAKALAVYNKALNDSSYLVMANVIRVLFAQSPREDSAALLSKFLPFEKYTRSSDVLIALANVYSWYGGPDKIWFYRKLRGFGSQYFESYKRFLSRMDYNAIAGQESYILTIDKFAKNGWDLSSYKNFLNELAKNLKKRPESTDKEKYDKLADRLQEKAKSLKITF